MGETIASNPDLSKLDEKELLRLRALVIEELKNR